MCFLTICFPFHFDIWVTGVESICTSPSAIVILRKYCIKDLKYAACTWVCPVPAPYPGPPGEFASFMSLLECGGGLVPSWQWVMCYLHDPVHSGVKLCLSFKAGGVFFSEEEVWGRVRANSLVAPQHTGHAHGRLWVWILFINIISLWKKGGGFLCFTVWRFQIHSRTVWTFCVDDDSGHEPGSASGDDPHSSCPSSTEGSTYLYI